MQASRSCLLNIQRSRDARILQGSRTTVASGLDCRVRRNRGVFARIFAEKRGSTPVHINSSRERIDGYASISSPATLNFAVLLEPRRGQKRTRRLWKSYLCVEMRVRRRRLEVESCEAFRVGPVDKDEVAVRLSPHAWSGRDLRSFRCEFGQTRCRRESR